MRPDGNVLYQSGPPVDQSFDPAQIPPPRHLPGIRKAALADGAEVILVTVRAGPDWLVETGESFVPTLTELRRLLVSLGLGFVVVAGVALGGGRCGPWRRSPAAPKASRTAISANGCQSRRQATSSRTSRKH